MELGQIQETLLVPLWARARETQKRRPMVEDHKAVEIVGKLAYDFRRFSREHKTQLAIAIRTLIFDSFVEGFMQHHPQGYVVEIATGLSSRFDRLDNGRIHWVEVDLEDTMRLRQSFFPPSSRRIHVVGDATKQDWTQLVPANQPVLIIIEGLLMYLNDSLIQDMLTHIGNRFPQYQILCDTVSPYAISVSRLQSSLRHMAARFTWAIEDTQELLHWMPGARRVEEYDITKPPSTLLEKFPMSLRLVTSVLRRVRPNYARSYRISHFCRS